MKKIYTYILMGVALVVLVFILLMLSPWFNIENIQIKGLERLDEASVIRDLKLDQTTSILNFNTLVAKKRLKDNYYIENINIEKEFPNSVKVNIKEREIVGYIPYINDYIYIDKTGLVVDIKSSYKEPLPIIYGLKFNKFIIGKKLKTDNEEAFSIVMEITNAIKKKEDLKGILKIDISDLNDIHLYMEKLDIILGKREAISIKMNILNEILKSFQPHEKYKNEYIK